MQRSRCAKSTISALIGVILSATTLAPAVSFAAASFDLLFPAGYGLSQATISASADVSLGPGVTIAAVDGSPGIVTNSGEGRLTVGPNGVAGSVVSVDSIQLGASVTADRGRSSKTVGLSPGDRIGSIQQATGRCAGKVKSSVTRHGSS